MMSMTCHNLEFARTRLDSVASGCSSNASFDRLHVKRSSKGLFRIVHRGFKARKLLCCRQDVGRCRVFSTRAPETLINGVVPGPPLALDLKRDSLTSLFEVVADDLQTLNKNLLSVSRPYSISFCPCPLELSEWKKIMDMLSACNYV